MHRTPSTTDTRLAAAAALTNQASTLVSTPPPHSTQTINPKVTPVPKRDPPLQVIRRL